MHSDFFLIEREGEAIERAERLALGETSGRNEAWLRDTLFRYPEILPIRDIDPSFGPLVPLCTELRTEAGPLDIAFLNPHGRLTLVECKLWRNPEARRKVVAQVLDYARAISRWSYADLQRQVAAATGKKGNTPYELVKQAHQDLSEQQFVDATHMAMRSGRFLLLIAGDGIREDVSALAELINRNAASGFSFGLVEVALYGLNDERLVIQPRTIAKTQIIERTVFIAREAGELKSYSAEDLEQETASAPLDRTVTAERNNLGESPKQAEYRRWWAPVLEMQFDDPDQEPPKLYYPNNVRIQLPWPGARIAAYSYGGADGHIAVGMGAKGSSAQQVLPRLRARQDEIKSRIPQSTIFIDEGSGDFCVTRRYSKDFKSDADKYEWLKSTLNSYVNVFRPLMQQLIREDRAEI